MAGLLSAGASVFAAPSADARCVHSGLVFSCVTAGAKPIMLSCYGADTGGVQTCIDFSGNTVLVGRHWRNHLTEVPDAASGGTSTDTQTDTSTQMTSSEDASFDAQLSAALAANAAASRRSGGTTRTKQQRPSR